MGKHPARHHAYLIVMTRHEVAKKHFRRNKRAISPPQSSVLGMQQDLVDGAGTSTIELTQMGLQMQTPYLRLIH